MGFKITYPKYVYYEQTCAASFEIKARQKLDTNWVDLDADLGWVCQKKENLKFYRTNFPPIKYQINPQGFRNSIDFDSIQPTSKKRILLIGDSFLFGIFLKNQTTISAHLQKKLGKNYEVFNLAVPAWGIDQMYQAYTKYIQKIAPDQVIFFYIDDDISRTIEAFFWGAGVKKSYQLKNGQLIFRKPTDGLLNQIESFFVFNSQIINRLYRCKCFEKAKPLTQVILKKVIESEKNYHRKLATIRFPRIEQIGNEISKKLDLTNFLNQNECTFLDMEKAIRLLPKQQSLHFYIPNDGHPSAKGAKYVANILIKKIISHNHNSQNEQN